jgi:hypothetical protein
MFKMQIFVNFITNGTASCSIRPNFQIFNWLKIIRTRRIKIRLSLLCKLKNYYLFDNKFFVF